MVSSNDNYPFPTQFDDVNEILRHFTADVQTILGYNFAGIYLGGSLALGDFNLEQSDIDLLVATTQPLPEQLIHKLREMHQNYHAGDSKWGIELEVSYLPLPAIRRYDPHHAYPTIERGGTLKVEPFDSGWLILAHILREHGITLAGVPIQQLIDPILPNLLHQALLDLFKKWWQPMIDDPFRLQHSGYHAYAVQTMCRILYTLHHHKIVSKQKAGEWAQTTMGERWQKLIAKGLSWQLTEADMDESVAFITVVADEVERAKMPAQLILLGTGTPNCQPDAYQSAWGVVVNEQPYLVDCGGGQIQRISQLRDYGLTALSPDKLTHLFLTHLHPDHTAGLADFLIAPWVSHRTKSVQIFGPVGTRQLCAGILSAYETGIAEHRDGLAPIDDPLLVEVVEVNAGICYQDAHITVEAIPMSHGGLTAFGYKFLTPDKTICFSGDSCPMPAFVTAVKGCDILLHEVYSAQSLVGHEPRWQKYHRTVHTSSVELAHMANEIQPKRLILTHQLLWGETTPADLMAEMGEIYDGEIIWGRDLDVFV